MLEVILAVIILVLVLDRVSEPVRTALLRKPGAATDEARDHQAGSGPQNK